VAVAVLILVLERFLGVRVAAVLADLQPEQQAPLDKGLLAAMEPQVRLLAVAVVLLLLEMQEYQQLVELVELAQLHQFPVRLLFMLAAVAAVQVLVA
jgi:hypothetical protein